MIRATVFKNSLVLTGGTRRVGCAKTGLSGCVAQAALTRQEQVATNRYTRGLVSYLDVVYAQTALLANQRVLTQISGQRMVAMAEKALADPSPKVRASAARALGPMGAESSVPKLKTALNDVEPSVVLAAAHSLFVLGHRDEVYDIDYEVLTGERKSADGFVKSQMNELKDPRAVAKMGLETGIGFAPFGGEAYEAFKRISKDDRSPVRAAAAKELATDRDPKIDAALAKACSDKKWPVRAAAVWAIAKRDDPTLLNAITPMLGDKSEIVRYDASAAVVRLTALRCATC